MMAKAAKVKVVKVKVVKVKVVKALGAGSASGAVRGPKLKLRTSPLLGLVGSRAWRRQ
jgi:hypothetical protein